MVNVKLLADDGDVTSNRKQYKKLVAELIDIISTHPNIAFYFSVSVVSQFMSSLQTTEWEVVFQTLRYLNRDPGHRGGSCIEIMYIL